MGRRSKVREPEGGRSARFDAELAVFRGARVSVVVGLTLADAWDRARADWPDLTLAHDPGDEACQVEVGGQSVILLARGFDLCTFVHEAVHAAAWVMGARGIPFTARNDEVVAHLTEWVVRELYAPAAAWPPAEQPAEPPADPPT